MSTSASMPVPVLNCPLCGHSGSTLFDQRKFRLELSPTESPTPLHPTPTGSTLPLVSNRLCGNCGLVYQSPRMSDSELETFYALEYRQLYQGSSEPTPKDLAVQAARASSLLHFAQELVHEVRRHLDIGSSAGLLLGTFRQFYGCQATGIEPGDAYRQYAQSQGLAVYSSLGELAAAGENKFDLISLAHVLEHIPDPVAYLAGLRRDWLSEAGWLLLEVPNLYGHDCFEIAHLVSYSAHTLKQVLQQAGYQVRASLVHGQPRSRLIPLYITVLASPVPWGSPAPEGSAAMGLPQPMSTSGPMPEKAVRRKRRAALLRRDFLTCLLPKQAWLPIPKASTLPGGFSDPPSGSTLPPCLL